MHAAEGIYAEGISVSTAILPDGWQTRLRTWGLTSSAPARPLFLEPHDLCVAKLMAEDHRGATSDAVGRDAQGGHRACTPVRAAVGIGSPPQTPGLTRTAAAGSAPRFGNAGPPLRSDPGPFLTALISASATLARVRWRSPLSRPCPGATPQQPGRWRSTSATMGSWKRWGFVS